MKNNKVMIKYTVEYDEEEIITKSQVELNFSDKFKELKIFFAYVTYIPY